MIMNDEVEDNSQGEITITTEIMIFFETAIGCRVVKYTLLFHF